MRHHGKITSWNDEKGFGFISRAGNEKPVFVHIKGFSNRQRRPVGGEIVSYELATDERGRPRAEKVLFAGEKRPKGTGAGGALVAVALAILFLAGLGLAVLLGKLPLGVPALYAAASVVAFGAYALDKSAAREGRWRTRESTLHLFSLVGGWPGALVAQKTLRHKSRKPSFQMVFWVTVVVNCMALAWAFTPGGMAVLHGLLRSWI